MLESIKNPGKKISEQDISKLEADVGCTLPADYKAFLLEFNGGRPRPNLFPVKSFENGTASVHTLLGIDRESESSRIDWHLREYGDRIPSELLPIGYSDTNDILCIALSGESVGNIYYWDSLNEVSKGSYDNIHHVATSFKEFLESLFEDEDY